MLLLIQYEKILTSDLLKTKLMFATYYSTDGEDISEAPPCKLQEAGGNERSRESGAWFLERDDNNTICAGKRDTKTKHGHGWPSTPPNWPAHNLAA